LLQLLVVVCLWRVGEDGCNNIWLLLLRRQSYITALCRQLLLLLLLQLLLLLLFLQAAQHESCKLLRASS
jgi:hypothetical protein